VRQRDVRTVESDSSKVGNKLEEEDVVLKLRRGSGGGVDTDKTKVEAIEKVCRR